MTSLPFGNDTSGIIKKLADRSIQADRRRNVFIIVTIALAACLMMSISLYSFGSTHDSEVMFRGRYQAGLGRFDMALLPELKNDDEIEKIGISAMVGSLRIDRDFINVIYRDSVNMALLSIELAEGRLPEQENEITAPASYLKKIGKEPTIGQRLTLDLGQNVPEEYIVCGITKDITNNVANHMKFWYHSPL